MTFYRFAWTVVYMLCRVLFRVRVIGAEKVPATGAYIVAPAHRSILDTPFASFITRRRVRFMAKRELFESRMGEWLFTKLGGIPVERGSATARSALKAVQAALADGEPAAVFPEGTRRHGPVVDELFDGAAYLAVKLGVPLVPVGVGGSEQILSSGKVVPKLHRVVVVVGDPIYPPAGASTRRRGDLQALTKELQDALQPLFDEALKQAGQT
ncbi:MAG: 1-acyl-sn-glycerol-3-phosphate acyltransferase [Actinobacteria bacterium]|nr:1-acyl-sn-glycerol-3-phosphate acyltransferase [Actinomycetota bacterium]